MYTGQMSLVRSNAVTAYSLEKKQLLASVATPHQAPASLSISNTPERELTPLVRPKFRGITYATAHQAYWSGSTSQPIVVMDSSNDSCLNLRLHRTTKLDQRP